MACYVSPTLICCRLGVEETDVSDSSDADDTERLEERLFLLVQEMDAVHSNDITG